MDEREARTGASAAVLQIVVTAVCALGVGWVVAALFGEPPAERWNRAVLLAISITVTAAVTTRLRRWQSRRETSRGELLTGLRVLEGEVSGLGTGWSLGKATVGHGRVEFSRGRSPFQRGRHPIVGLDVVERSAPRDSTLRESLRVGTEARVVELVTTSGARVQMAAILPRSMPSVLAALGD